MAKRGRPRAGNSGRGKSAKKNKHKKHNNAKNFGITEETRRITRTRAQASMEVRSDGEISDLEISDSEEERRDNEVGDEDDGQPKTPAQHQQGKQSTPGNSGNGSSNNGCNGGKTSSNLSLLNVMRNLSFGTVPRMENVVVSFSDNQLHANNVCEGLIENCNEERVVTDNNQSNQSNHNQIVVTENVDNVLPETLEYDVHKPKIDFVDIQEELDLISGNLLYIALWWVLDHL